MANLEKIIKISKANYDTLYSSGSVMIDGVTYTYDPNALYLTPTGENPNDHTADCQKRWVSNNSRAQIVFPSDKCIFPASIKISATGGWGNLQAEFHYLDNGGFGVREPPMTDANVIEWHINVSGSRYLVIDFHTSIGAADRTSTQWQIIYQEALWADEEEQ